MIIGNVASKMRKVIKKILMMVGLIFFLLVLMAIPILNFVPNRPSQEIWTHLFYYHIFPCKSLTINFSGIRAIYDYCKEGQPDGIWVGGGKMWYTMPWQPGKFEYKLNSETLIPCSRRDPPFEGFHPGITYTVEVRIRTPEGFSIPIWRGVLKVRGSLLDEVIASYGEYYDLKWFYLHVGILLLCIILVTISVRWIWRKIK